jgi:ABC-type transport system involved in multi-copper enzyme maturation permease subunit
VIWKIAKKDFLLNLMTFKFAVGTILCVVLVAVFMPVLVKDYQQRLGVYNRNVADNEAEIRKVKVYKNITPTIYRPPAVLSVFSEGAEKQLGNSAKIELENVPEISAASARGNPYLSIFPVFDASVIFKIVISVLALLVAYDVVSGERAGGTLKLTLSGAVPRPRLLLGKLLAGLMTLAVPITIAFIVGVLILVFSPMVDLSSSDWARIGLMYIASVIFISAMYNVGLLFSCLTKQSAISLVLGLFFWIICVVVIPDGSVYLAGQVRPLESEEKMESRLRLVEEERDSELEETRERIPSGWAESTATGAFGGNYPLVCNKAGMERYNKSAVLLEPIRIKYAEKLWEVRKNSLESLFGQRDLARNLSRTSPISLYENAMSALAGTDLVSFQYFTDKVKEHRDNVIEYVRSKTDNFSSLSYFTRCKEGDWEESQKVLEGFMEAQNEAERQSIMEAYMSWRDKKIAETPSLDLQDFPQFTYDLDLLESMRRAIPDLALLIFVSVLFFALSFVAFMNYDVR